MRGELERSSDRASAGGRQGLKSLLHTLGEPVSIRMMFGRRDPVYMILRRAGPRSVRSCVASQFQEFVQQPLKI